MWTARRLFISLLFFITVDSEGVKDNRNLCDSNDNQKLSREEIEQMKQKGVSRKVKYVIMW